VPVDRSLVLELERIVAAVARPAVLAGGDARHDRGATVEVQGFDLAMLDVVDGRLGPSGWPEGFMSLGGWRWSRVAVEDRVAEVEDP